MKFVLFEWRSRMGQSVEPPDKCTTALTCVVDLFLGLLGNPHNFYLFGCLRQDNVSLLFNGWNFFSFLSMAYPTLCWISYEIEGFLTHNKSPVKYMILN